MSRITTTDMPDPDPDDHFESESVDSVIWQFSDEGRARPAVAAGSKSWSDDPHLIDLCPTEWGDRTIRPMRDSLRRQPPQRPAS